MKGLGGASLLRSCQNSYGGRKKGKAQFNIFFPNI